MAAVKELSFLGVFCLTLVLLRAVWTIYNNKSAHQTVLGFGWLILLAVGFTLSDGVPTAIGLAVIVVLLLQKLYFGSEVEPTQHRGHHVFLDFTNVIDEDPTAMAKWMMERMLSACREFNVKVVHHHSEVFVDDSPAGSPPGFASAVLVDESHVTAHCYSTIGLLAVDVFTCGAKPQVTKLIAKRLQEGIAERYPNSKGRLGEVPRFPTAISQNSSKFVIQTPGGSRKVQ